VIDFALDLARGAGQILLSRYGRLAARDIDHKGRVDLVTRADHEAEAYLVDAIRGRYPDHAVLTEEGAPETGSAPHRWILDPLDGTTNFVHRFPFFCVSIGLEVDGRLELGVVHAPRLEETFHAVRGGGAFLGEERLRVSTTTALIEALLATGFPYDRFDGDIRTNLDEFARLTMRSRGVRRAGSAALDLAYVAAGRFDGYWEFGLSPWDVAAGAVLVAEAGGRVTDLDGGHDHLFGRQIVATNGALHAPLVAAVQEGYSSR
jgi:myo-inositol-1(or 4)-monophosphatase